MAKRRKSKRKGGLGSVNAGLRPYVSAMKMSKGKSCNRKAMLKAVKGGATPTEAVRRHCRD